MDKIVERNAFLKISQPYSLKFFSNKQNNNFIRQTLPIMHFTPIIQVRSAEFHNNWSKLMFKCIMCIYFLICNLTIWLWNFGIGFFSHYIVHWKKLFRVIFMSSSEGTFGRYKCSTMGLCARVCSSKTNGTDTCYRNHFGKKNSSR